MTEEFPNGSIGGKLPHQPEHEPIPNKNQECGNLLGKVPEILHKERSTDTKLNVSLGQQDEKGASIFNRSACSDQSLLEQTQTTATLETFDSTSDSSVAATNESTTEADYTRTTLSVKMPPQKHRDKWNYRSKGKIYVIFCTASCILCKLPCQF